MHSPAKSTGSNSSSQSQSRIISAGMIPAQPHQSLHKSSLARSNSLRISKKRDEPVDYGKNNLLYFLITAVGSRIRKIDFSR